MSKDKPPELDPDQTLATLDQLSKAINVMSAVVERLKRHLHRQLELNESRSTINAPRPARNPRGKLAIEAEAGAVDPAPIQRPERVLH